MRGARYHEMKDRGEADGYEGRLPRIENAIYLRWWTRGRESRARRLYIDREKAEVTETRHFRPKAGRLRDTAG